MIKHQRVVILFMLTLLVQSVAASEHALNALFQRLKQSADDTTARQYENSIWLAWFESGDSEVDDLMQQAMRKRRSYNFEAALEILNQVLARQPEYAEAWNQRATVHFHLSEFEKSLQDIARALELEPRHFGAMAGRAMIRLRQSKPALARQNIIQALKIHPYLPERSLFPGLE